MDRVHMLEQDTTSPLVSMYMQDYSKILRSLRDSRGSLVAERVSSGYWNRGRKCKVEARSVRGGGERGVRGLRESAREITTCVSAEERSSEGKKAAALVVTRAAADGGPCNETDGRGLRESDEGRGTRGEVPMTKKPPLWW